MVTQAAVAKELAAAQAAVAKAVAAKVEDTKRLKKRDQNEEEKRLKREATAATNETPGLKRRYAELFGRPVRPPLPRAPPATSPLRHASSGVLPTELRG